MADPKMFQEIADKVISGKANDVKALVEAAVAKGVRPAEVLTQGLVAGMAVVGKKFRANEFFIPEVLIAARAMKTGLAVLEPYFVKDPPPPKGKIVIGTVRGDLHDIGKNLVAVMLKGAGFNVVDLGVDIGADKFAKAVQDNNPQIVALSALLTTTMVNMKEVVQALQKAGFKGKVIVGGAPVTLDFAKEIGAQLYAADAAEAVEVVEKALKAMNVA
ncbi:MAG: corrinoid protein [Planctomycetota bacterium]